MASGLLPIQKCANVGITDHKELKCTKMECIPIV
jgi:hypothetical protein